MVLDPKWSKARKLGLKVTIAVALSSVGVLVLEQLGWRNPAALGPMEPFSKSALIIVSVVSSTLAVVGVIDYLMASFRENRVQSERAGPRPVRRAEEEDQRDARRKPPRGETDKGP